MGKVDRLLNIPQWVKDLAFELEPENRSKIEYDRAIAWLENAKKLIDKSRQKDEWEIIEICLERLRSHILKSTKNRSGG